MRDASVRFCHIAACALLALALPLGCRAAPEPAPAPPRPPWAFPEAAPGVYELPDGRTQVLGTLAREPQLEGGFWFVAPHAPDATGTATARRRIVVTNAEMFTDPTAPELEGEYVVIEGSLLEGGTVRMAGAELEADVLNRVANPAEGPFWFENDVPFRWARIEKPGTQWGTGNDVRTVGMLVYLPGDGGSREDMWAVRGVMPYEDLSSGRVLALLEGGAFGNPRVSTWNEAYVSVRGSVTDDFYVGETRVPVVHVGRASVLTTQPVLPDERR